MVLYQDQENLRNPLFGTKKYFGVGVRDIAIGESTVMIVT